MSKGTLRFEQTLTMTVTDQARAKFQEYLGEDRDLSDFGIRMVSEAGGCSGASYGMQLAEAPEERELTLTANKVDLYFLPEHAPLLNGAVIDFVDEATGSGFKIHNPTITNTCSCGN